MITKLEAVENEIASSVRLNHHNAWRDYRLARTIGLFATGLSALALEVSSRSQLEYLSQSLMTTTLVGVIGGMASLSQHWRSGFDIRESVAEAAKVSDIREALPEEIAPHVIGRQIQRLDIDIKDFNDLESPEVTAPVRQDTVHAARNIREWYKYGILQEHPQEVYGVAQIIAEILEIAQIRSDTPNEEFAVDIDQELAPYYEVLDAYLPLAPDTESWQQYFAKFRQNVTNTRTIERLIEPVRGRSPTPQSV